eukprot:GEMP01027375.1.p1 GENE.GEMP01027375.1~~GEMP01027375.1.p1  ORF type:complete len:464 (-),score=129.65 GEMP01027375.1:909-2300(-)
MTPLPINSRPIIVGTFVAEAKGEGTYDIVSMMGTPPRDTGHGKMKHQRFPISEVAKDAKNSLLSDFSQVRKKSDVEGDDVTLADIDSWTHPRLNDFKSQLLSGRTNSVDSRKYRDHYDLFQSETEETTIHKARPKARQRLRRNHGHIARTLCDIDVVDDSATSTVLKKEMGGYPSALSYIMEDHREDIRHLRDDMFAKERLEKTGDMWDLVIADLEVVKDKHEHLSPTRREACSAVRLLVYGEVINDPKELDKVCNESIGAKDKVVQLWRRWRALDADNSGRVDVPEFRTFVRKQLSGEQLDKVETAIKDIFGKKSSCSLDCLMRVIWPTADTAAVKLMKTWIDEHQAQMCRVKTPQLIREDERLGLVELFRYFDTDRSGTLSMEELVSSQLLDREQATRYLADFQKSREDELNLDDFLNIFCPVGYRVSEDVFVARDADGCRIYFDPSYGKKGQWMAELSCI